LRRAGSLAPRLRIGFDKLLSYSRGLMSIDRRVNGSLFLAAVVFVSLVALYSPAISSRIGFPTDRFPVAAASALEKLPADARIFSSDGFGGYLIYHFAGQRKVFFDGRSDFYGVEFMKQYLTLSSARPGWEEIVKRYGFTHALLTKDSPLES